MWVLAGTTRAVDDGGDGGDGGEERRATDPGRAGDPSAGAVEDPPDPIDPRFL